MATDNRLPSYALFLAGALPRETSERIRLSPDRLRAAMLEWYDRSGLDPPNAILSPSAELPVPLSEMTTDHIPCAFPDRPLGLWWVGNFTGDSDRPRDTWVFEPRMALFFRYEDSGDRLDLHVGIRIDVNASVGWFGEVSLKELALFERSYAQFISTEWKVVGGYARAVDLGFELSLEQARQVQQSIAIRRAVSRAAVWPWIRAPAIHWRLEPVEDRRQAAAPVSDRGSYDRIRAGAWARRHAARAAGDD